MIGQTRVWAVAVAIVTTAGGCALPQRGDAGSVHSHRFKQPPREAAQCFARNAEEHSSALKAEVNAARDGVAQTIVRVKNGVTYATADFRRSGAGSAGTITLMVITSGRRGDLLDALVEGC